MKKFIYMAVAAMVAFSSCSKDNDPTIVSENGNQALTFTASMENGVTRATLDGNKASWVVGDKINVNGTIYTAQADGLITTFAAATEGDEAEGTTYKAYFPANLYDGTTATLPATITETWVDGQFNMPMYATSSSTNLEFKNLCGVLKITVTDAQIAAVKRIKVSSKNLAVSGAFTVNSDNAAVLDDVSTTTNTLTVTYTTAVPTDENPVFYVAVPAQTYQELKIELEADGSGSTKSMTTKAATVTVARNTIYPIDFNSSSPYSYVDLGLPSGIKWATCNIGATSPEQYGDYFAWGEIEPYYTEGHAADPTIATGNWKPDKSEGYNWPSYRWTTDGGSTFTRYNTTDGLNPLKPEDDAATVKWGGSWRMPTKDEYIELKNNCYWKWVTEYNGQTVNGYIVYKAKHAGDKGKVSNSSSSYSPSSSYGTSSDPHIFLPAAGDRYEASLRNAGSSGYYWSSLLCGSNSAGAYSLLFNSGDVYTNLSSRVLGHSVRAVCP